MKKPDIEPEWKGSSWTHPYNFYIWLTVIIFLGVVFAGFMLSKSGCVPNGNQFRRY